MRRAYKFRLWTNANQERELSILLETSRRLYNACLAQRKDAYESEKKSVRYVEQSTWFKAERATNPWFARLNFSSAQATMRRLDRAFANFFRRVKAKATKPGYPRFKARDRFESIEFPRHGDGIRLTENRLRVQHVGVIRVCLHRETEGEIKTLSLKREAGKWYLVVSCDLGERVVPPSTNPPVGVDLGLEAFLTTSDGERVENPRVLRAALPELRRRSRALSRKKRGGQNRRKARARVARLHARVRNLRREHHVRVARSLTRRYGLIAVEGLTVRNMVKNRRLSRAISDAGWSGFVSTLRHKAEEAGAEVVEVDPAYTSQTCPDCGTVKAKTLAERRHSCVCGATMHRDEAAARVIFARGLLARTGPAGRNVGVSLHAPRSRRLQPAE